jgi:hypothetical protein
MKYKIREVNGGKRYLCAVDGVMILSNHDEAKVCDNYNQAYGYVYDWNMTNPSSPIELVNENGERVK